MTDDNSKFDRRKFLGLTGAGGIGLLAGCGGQNTADQTTEAMTTTAADETTSGGDDTETTQSSDSSGGNVGGTFIGAASEDAPTLDPRMNELAWANSFLHYIFDTLMAVSPDGSEIVPHLAAEQPTQVDDTTFEFKLREGVTFHNGQEMTAEDVAYSFNWVLNPDNPSPNRAALSFIDSVEATGDYTARFNLKYPFALFNLTLAGMNAPVVPKGAAEEMGHEEFGNNPIGTGPFSFVEHQSASHIMLERNPDYFLKQPNVEKFRMRIIPKPQVQFVELATGGVHEATVPKNLTAKAKQEENIKTTLTSHLDYNGLIFNGMREPFDNRKVRKAMQYLVDYDEMLRVTKGDLGNRAYGFMPKSVNEAWGFPWQEWKEKFYPGKDHEEAKRLLEEAGYGDGFGKKLHMSSLASSKFKNMATVLQSELKKIGIESEVQEVTIGQWLTDLDTGEFDVTIYGWSGGQDPDGFFYYLFRDLRNDEGGMGDVAGNASASFLYQNDQISDDKKAEVDQKIRQARKLQSREERKKLYTELAEFWQGQYPHIPVFSEQAMTGWRKEVKDYQPTSFLNQPLVNQWNNAYLEGQ
jgi:peptide/nickel transport system substrate-binding protein